MKQYLFKNKKLLLLFVLVSALSALPAMFLVYLDQFIVHVAEKKLVHEIPKCIALIIVFFVSFACLAYSFQYIKNKFLKKILIDIKQDLYEGILNKSIVEFDSETTSFYVSTYNNDLKLIEEKYIIAIFSLIMDVSELIAGSIYALYINIYAGMLMILTAVISLLLPKYLSKGLAKLNEESMKEHANYNNKLRDSFAGFETIKTYNIEQNMKTEHTVWNSKLERIKYLTAFKSGRVRVTNNIFITCSQLLLLALSGYLVIIDRIDLSLMVALLQLSGSIFYPMSSTIDYINDIKSSKPIREKVEKLIKYKTSDETDFHSIEDVEKITFKHVDFKYPEGNRNILNDISFNIFSKQKVLIAGESGCGKSTILKLILKYYPAVNGTICINDLDIQFVNTVSLLNKIAFIPQNVFIFNDSLLNNITLFKQYSDAEINEAMEKASLHVLVDHLDEGLNTNLSENGNNFSGGEKQRIAIARAYLSGKKFFVIDEMTSALDANTARQIEEMLIHDDEISCILISHKFDKELLNSYDQIITIESGRIQEVGTYESLMNNKNLFYKLCKGKR